MARPLNGPSRFSEKNSGARVEAQLGQAMHSTTDFRITRMSNILPLI
jgi:hypothetical protein